MLIDGKLVSAYVKETVKNEVVDFYYVKGILDVMFERVGAKVKYAPLANACPELHPGRSASIILNNEVIGYVGELHPTLVKQEDIEPTYVFEVKLEALFNIPSNVILFKQISKVPSVERDLALVMDLSTPVGEVVDAIYRCDKAMIKKVSVFDIYVGDKIENGKKSVAVRITLESLDTSYFTLTLGATLSIQVTSASTLLSTPSKSVYLNTYFPFSVNV